ncbi:hypothetical protein RhiirC2_575919 [Rhizophagus irregularis]|uniref:Uncharacterized protein n=1 Tax=Rhizophagus irregularis TaxID=588596 RepID=A0A2N1NW36_9GLOM|nr:hypothetical protein RhiirC2_575919 [Rhizophagus irregularis]
MLKEEQLVVLAIDRKNLLDTFEIAIKRLEACIDSTRHYSDWNQRKQSRDNIDSIQFQDLESNKQYLEVHLFNVGSQLRDKENPSFLVEELEEEFKRWISSLTHDFLTAQADEYARKLSLDAQERNKRMSNEQLKHALNFSFGNVNNYFNQVRKEEKELGNKNYSEITIQNKFNGDAEQGGKDLELILSEYKKRGSYGQVMDLS